MPMSGSTRMLRARRKDCNVKPNRRLDRKSSRGMLFENEELRMRTITINAEVEQGQHALKKLRRENEQLRREMWCLRDEYDKMEKLLKKREEGEESDQENSDSDENGSRTDESDEDARAPGRQEANPDSESEENAQKPSPKFGNEPNARTFDGLSVIDEQTEETQTTESAAGYGTLSRGNSANRTFHQSALLQDEACRIPDLPPYGYALDSFGEKMHVRKKGFCPYENGGGFPGEYATGQCDSYDVRPSSPYPYNGSFRPSYQKRLQVLQELPLVPQTPANAIGENGWIFPDPGKLEEVSNYNVYVDDPMRFLSGKSPERNEVGFDVIRDRGGPDVFVTGGYVPLSNQLEPTDVAEEQENLIDDVKAEIDKIDISEKSESDPKIPEVTALTKSPLSPTAPDRRPNSPQHETLHPGKLTMDAAAEKNDNSISIPVQQLVTCQNSNGQHVRETIQTGHPPPPPEDMPFAEKPPGSKYQTKLMVTLKSPGVRAEGKVPKKVPGPVVPRGFQQQGPRYGMRAEYAAGQRFQTFPSPGVQPRARAGAGAGSGRECLVSPYAGVRGQGGGLFGSLPRLPTLVPKSEVGVTASNIPEELDKDVDVLPDEESLLVPATQSLAKAVKIPPVPPPRTSSCPKPIIPPPPPGPPASYLRTFRKGKPLQPHDSQDRPPEAAIYNPLLMSQPIATSSPTISLKGPVYPAASSESLYGSKHRKPSYTEDSSVEEFSRQKIKLREEFPRAEVPKLNKSLSSPSFGSFRTPRRKHSEALAASVENILSQKIPEAISLSEKVEKKIGKSRASQNNASVSSSSGLDSPTKSDSRKRRVSIQFKKKQSHGEGKRGEEDGGGKDSTDSRRDSMLPGILSVKSGGHKGKGKGEETDGTTSDRERTNSVSSRTSSVMAGSSRRKYSISSNRTYLNEEKIPWCGCWGNGCV